MFSCQSEDIDQSGSTADVATKDLKPKFEQLSYSFTLKTTNAVKTFFQNEQAFMNEIVDTKYVDGVIDGTYNVTAKGDSDSILYMMFSDSTGKVEAVYPLRNQ